MRKYTLIAINLLAILFFSFTIFKYVNYSTTVHEKNNSKINLSRKIKSYETLQGLELLEEELRELRQEEELKGAIKNYRPGNIVFAVPERMYEGKSEIIEVNITDDLQKNLKKEIEKVRKINETINVEENEIKIYSLMKARLGGLDFDINPLDEESQVVMPKQVVKWRWSVTPKKTGEQILLLNLYAKLKVGDSDEFVNLKAFERNIKVDVSYSRLFQNNWQHFLPFLFGGSLFVFITTKFKLIIKKIKNWNKNIISRINKN